MRYVISERQFRILLEQPDSKFGAERFMTAAEKANPSAESLYKAHERQSEFIKSLDPHVVLGITSIGSAFIPFVGPLLSAGFSALDAGLYYKEGDNKSAAIVGALTLIPIIGTIVTKIPGAKELGVKGMATLAKKLSEGAKNLSSLELKVANAINSNKDLIVREIKLATSKLPEVQKHINAYKKLYVSKFGQESYDEILRRLFNGGYTKKDFIDKLKSATKSVAKYAELGAFKGIQFAQREIKALDDLVNQTKKTKKFQSSINLGGQNIKVYFDDFAEKWRGLANEGTGEIWMNMKNMKNLEEIKQVLYHEAAHIKDAAMKSPKLSGKYSQIMSARRKVYDEIENFNHLSTETLETLKSKYDDLYKKYYTHPWEITANNQMLINNVSSNVQKLITKKTPQKVISRMDELLNSIKQNTKIGWDEYLDLLGMEGLSHLTYLKWNKPQEYNNLLKKLYQQITLTKKNLGLLR